MTLRVITFKLEEEILEKLDLLCKVLNRSRSELIREAIENLIKRYEYQIETEKMLEKIAEVERFRIF